MNKLAFSNQKKKIASIVIWLAINLALILLLVKTFSPTTFSSSNFEFLPLLGRCDAIYISDLDKNGTDDLAVSFINEPLPYNRLLQIFSPFSPSGLYKFSFFLDTLLKTNDSLFQPEDIDNDGEIEVPILTIKEGQLTLKILDPTGNIERIVNFNRPLEKGQEGVASVVFSDLDNDGQKEMITSILSTFSGAPRAIAAWDLAKAELKWSFHMGCMPDIFEITDINQDGKKEIIVMGRAPHNGVSANGTDDDHSYIFTLNHQGQLLWRLTVGGYYTRWWIKTFDLDGDGQLEIIASKGCDREIDPEPGEIRIIEAATGATEYLYNEPPSFSEIFLLPKNNAEIQLVVGNSTGDVILFDRHLNPIKRMRVDHPAIVRGVAKLGHLSGRNSLFVQAGFTKFLIFNENLKEIYRFNLDYFFDMNRLSFHTIRNHSQNYGLINASRLYLIEKRSLSFFNWLAQIFTSKFVSHLFVILLFNGLFAYLFALRSPISTIELKLQSDWLEHAQDLAHRMKNALFTIQLQAENLKIMAQKKLDEATRDFILPISQSIIEDVSELGRQTRILMKLLAPRPLSLKKVEINQIIQKAIGKYLNYYQDKIEFNLDLDDESTAAMVDEEQIEEALSNLISNAIDAMPEGGRLTLRTTVIHSPGKKEIKGLEIEVEDSGLGIPEEKLSEIFKPSFTTKKEGLGIGLTITKRIIEAHGGRISVFSKVGVGTKFAIYLPAKGNH